MSERNLKFHLVALLVILLGFLTTVAASEFVLLSLEKLISLSSHVVQGKFVKIEGMWNNDRTAILTRAVFQVEGALKGNLTKEQISIYLPGGTVGDTSMIVVGAPEINIGEQIVLMIQRVGVSQREVTLQAREEPFSLVALSQAKFDVKLDSTTNKIMAVSHALKLFLKPDAKIEDLPPGGRVGLPLNEFVDKIREIHQKQLKEGKK